MSDSQHRPSRAKVTGVPDVEEARGRSWKPAEVRLVVRREIGDEACGGVVRVALRLYPAAVKLPPAVHRWPVTHDMRSKRQQLAHKGAEAVLLPSKVLRNDQLVLADDDDLL